MIIVKQSMWIIRFGHGDVYFQSNQSLLYESLPLDQVHDVINIEFLKYKDISLSKIKYVNSDYL